MHFTITTARINDRHTEPKVCNIPHGMPMPPKHEEITIKINFIGSGDTRSITNEMILFQVMERLEKIEKIGMKTV